MADELDAAEKAMFNAHRWVAPITDAGTTSGISKERLGIPFC